MCQECRDEDEFYLDEKFNGPSWINMLCWWLEKHWFLAVAVAVLVGLLIAFLSGCSSVQKPPGIAFEPRDVGFQPKGFERIADKLDIKGGPTETHDEQKVESVKGIVSVVDKGGAWPVVVCVIGLAIVGALFLVRALRELRFWKASALAIAAAIKDASASEEKLAVVRELKTIAKDCIPDVFRWERELISRGLYANTPFRWQSDLVSQPRPSIVKNAGTQEVPFQKQAHSV